MKFRRHNPRPKILNPLKNISSQFRKFLHRRGALDKALDDFFKTKHDPTHPYRTTYPGYSK